MFLQKISHDFKLKEIGFCFKFNFHHFALIFHKQPRAHDEHVKPIKQTLHRHNPVSNFATCQVHHQTSQHHPSHTLSFRFKVSNILFAPTLDIFYTTKNLFFPLKPSSFPKALQRAVNLQSIIHTIVMLVVFPKRKRDRCES